MSAGIRTLHPIALGLALALPAHARADCISYPQDALCGSFVSSGAVSGNSSVVSQEIDAATTQADQTLGPAYTERLAGPDPANPGNITQESARAAIAVDQGVLAIEMWTTADANDFGANVSAGSASRLSYDEELTVQSASVPPSTEVNVRLRYQVASGRLVADSLDPATVASFNYQSQYSDVQVEVSAYLDNHLGATPFDQGFWNEFYGFDPTTTGVFARANPVVELVAPVQVGQTIRLHFYVNGGAGSEASVLGQFPPYTFPTAQSGATIAVVFGLACDTPGVTLQSALLGGPMPDLAGVTYANALANAIPVDLPVGGPVTVPEPGAAAAALAAAIGLAACAAARRRR